MKKMIAKILVLTLLMFYPGLYFVSATEYKDDIAVKNVNEQLTDKAIEEKSEYNKLHFYFDVEEYETIDDSDELEKAIETIPENKVSQGVEADVSTYRLTNYTQESNEVTITVEFESDFMETEKYIEYSEQRANLRTRFYGN